MNTKIVMSFFFVIVGFWLGLSFVLMRYLMPYNSLSTSVISKEQMILNGIFPERFSFFTRDPREPQMIIVEANTKKDVLAAHRSYIHSWVGFNRANRALLVELGYVMKTIPVEGWINCIDDECGDGRIATHYVANAYSHPLLCGEYYIRYSNPIPWAWAHAFERQHKKMPFKLASVSIQCANSHGK